MTPRVYTSFFIIQLYRGSPHFVISEFMVPAISWFIFMVYFVNSSIFRDFEIKSKAKQKKKSENFQDYFFDFCLFFIFFYVLSYLCSYKEVYYYFLWFMNIINSVLNKAELSCKLEKNPVDCPHWKGAANMMCSTLSTTEHYSFIIYVLTCQG